MKGLVASVRRTLVRVTVGMEIAGMRQILWPMVMRSNEGKPAPNDIGWQEAVARLAQERTLAETCAGLLKKYGDASTIDRGTLVYADAKAEYDGIIAGLTVALVSCDHPSSLPDLEVRLRRGFGKRVAFTESVQRLLPPPSRDEKGLVDTIIGSTIGPLIDAIRAISLRIRDDNAIIRKMIETQLEATRWPSFESISSPL
jgi:hypothetical protein